MRIIVVGTAGIAAHLASFVFARYAQWLLSKVLQGAGNGWSRLDYLRKFFNDLPLGLADRLCGGRSSGHLNEYDDGYRPGYFGAR